jgi:hypothetical protein
MRLPDRRGAIVAAEQELGQPLSKELRKNDQVPLPSRCGDPSASWHRAERTVRAVLEELWKFPNLRVFSGVYWRRWKTSRPFRWSVRQLHLEQSRCPGSSTSAKVHVRRSEASWKGPSGAQSAGHPTTHRDEKIASAPDKEAHHAGAPGGDRNTALSTIIRSRAIPISSQDHSPTMTSLSWTAGCKMKSSRTAPLGHWIHPP